MIDCYNDMDSTCLGGLDAFIDGFKSTANSKCTENMNGNGVGDDLDKTINISFNRMVETMALIDGGKFVSSPKRCWQSFSILLEM